MKGFFPAASYNHTPRVGDILLFPPWAVHSVDPSTFSSGSEDSPRVAWAFNVLTSKCRCFAYRPFY